MEVLAVHGQWAVTILIAHLWIREQGFGAWSYGAAVAVATLIYLIELTWLLKGRK